MTRTEMIQSCILDAMKGDPFPLRDLWDYLTNELGFEEHRLIIIAKRKFGLNVRVCHTTLEYLDSVQRHIH